MVWGPPGPAGPPPGQPGWPGPHGQPTWPSAPGIPAGSEAHGRPGWPSGPAPYGPAAAPPGQPHQPPSPGADHAAPPADADPFTRAEYETRATIAAPWWATASPPLRRQSLLPCLLTLNDHSWWMFGAWARWYRWHPSDARWFPGPPPRSPAIRQTARPAQPGDAPPPIPPGIMPGGPDFAYYYGPPLAIAGRPVSGALAYRLRSVLQEATMAPPADYPLGWSHFLHGTPSTIAATWSAMLWCASVPVFDPELDSSLIEFWEGHFAQPLDDHGRLRWLAPPPLQTIIALYTERLRAGRADAAGQIVRCMVMTAQALRDDPRFKVRASALLSIIEPLQANPALDHPALPYGDQAVERGWLARCPLPLAATLLPDTSPGEHFQRAFYDLAEALEPLCGAPDVSDHIEPRHAAIAMLASDMAGYRPDLATPVGTWLDPELRALLTDVLAQPDHPLRALWPVAGRLPAGFTPADPTTALCALSATAATDIAWCRLTNGIPIPPDGFTVPDSFAIALGELQARIPGSGEAPAVIAASPPGAGAPPPAPDTDEPAPAKPAPTTIP